MSEEKKTTENNRVIYFKIKKIILENFQSQKKKKIDGMNLKKELLLIL